MTPDVRSWWQRLLFGASVGAIASVIVQAGNFLLGLAVARMLGATAFGHWSVVYATLLTVTSFGTLGTGVVASKCAAELRQDDSAATRATLSVVHRLNMGLAIASSALLLLGSNFLAGHVIGYPDSAAMLRWGSLFVLFTVLAAFWAGVIAGYEAYPKQVVNNIVATALLLCTTFILIPRFGMLAVVAPLALSAFVQLTANRRAARRLNQHVGRAEPDLPKPWSTTLALALPTGATGILTAAALWFSTMYLFRARGPDEVALFAVANSLRSIAAMGITFLTSAALVIQSSAARQRNHDLGLEDRLHITVTGISIMGAAALYGITGWILTLYGPGFRNATSVVGILTISLVVEAIGMTLYNSLVIRHRLLENFFVAVLPREIGRVLLVVLLADRGAHGVAWAFLGSAALFTGITAIEYYGFARRERPSPTTEDSVDAEGAAGIIAN